MLLGFVRPQLWALPALVVLGLVASAAEGFGIGMLIPLLDALMQSDASEETGGWFVSSIRRYGAGLTEDARLALLIGTIFALVLVKSVLLYAYAALSAWFNASIIHGLRTALFRQLLEVGYAFLARSDRGQLVNILERESWQTSDALRAMSSLCIHACSILALGVLLLLVSWQMTLAVAGAIALVALLLRVTVRHAHRLGEAGVAAYAALAGRILEGLDAARVVRLFGREDDELDRFRRASDHERRVDLRIELVKELTQPLSETLYVLLFLGTLIFAWHQEVGLATLLTFLVLLYRLQPQVKGFDARRVEFASVMPGLQEVIGLLERRNKPYIRSGARPFTRLRSTIEYERVSFRYAEGGRSALDNITCQIRRHQATAIVGGSGAGKSTMTNLLARLYDPDAGEIRIDGVPLADLDLRAWRSRLAFAGQDVDLMGGTVFENIAYGRPGIDEAGVIAAARQADAHDFITGLPDGYATRVGERGVRLSAGQRQRISLARALARKPDVLILDEATNALDSPSEQAIQNALQHLSGRLTMILIAHRLSTVRLADQVIALDEGRIVEQGRPDELMRNPKSHFARLWHLQVAPFGAPAGAG